MALVHASPDLAVDVSRLADVTTVILDGTVDLATAPELRAALLPLVVAGQTVVLDLAGVTFVDSTGLGVLVAAHRRAKAAGSRFLFSRPTENLRAVLRITRLDAVFQVEPAFSGFAPGDEPAPEVVAPLTG